MARQTVYLNNEKLARLLEEREVKQWWLARRIGVDRKTIARWLAGKTQRISKDSLAALCRELDCDERELMVTDHLEALGTREDRWAAARRLQHSKLTEMVGPSYSWDLAESLIRSTIDPEMPLDLQAALYLQLGTCGMYQHHHALVRSSAEIALKKAQQAKDELIALQAVTMLGNEALMIGDMKRAVHFYNLAISKRSLFQEKSRLAATLSNLAECHHLLANFAEALETFQEAVEVWAECSPVISMTTAWFLKARLHLDLLMLDEAREAIAECRRVCDIIKYRKNANMCIGLEAEIASIEGDHELAVELADKTLEAFEETPNLSPEAREAVIRVLRRAGQTERSRKLLDDLLASPIDDTYSVAKLNLELARHLMLDGNRAEAEACVEKANELFRSVGTPRRVISGLPGEPYVDWRVQD